MRLPSQDLHQVLLAVRLLNLDYTLETLPRRTFDAVRCLIPTDTISFEAFGNDNYYHGPLWFEPTANVSNQMLATMNEHVMDHPIILGLDTRKTQGTVRLSDFVTLPKFKNTIIYNEFFKLLGTNRQLAVSLHITPELTVACSLCRLGMDYTSRDCSVLELLVPHLVNAFRSAQFVRRINQQSANIAIVSVDNLTHQVIENDAAQRLIAKYYFHHESVLPLEINDYVNFHRRIFVSGEYYLPPKPIEKITKNGKLVSSLIFLSNTRITLLFEEIDFESKAEFVRYGLTHREKEALFWVSQGKTDPEIAGLLNISVRTVHKHLENMFVKLGVENRTAAASTIYNR